MQIRGLHGQNTRTGCDAAPKLGTPILPCSAPFQDAADSRLLDSFPRNACLSGRGRLPWRRRHCDAPEVFQVIRPEVKLPRPSRWRRSIGLVWVGAARWLRIGSSQHAASSPIAPAPTALLRRQTPSSMACKVMPTATAAVRCARCSPRSYCDCPVGDAGGTHDVADTTRDGARGRWHVI